MVSILILLGISVLNLAILVFILLSLHKKNLLKPVNKTEELEDFLSDMRSHGYSVVRVDPANVYYRGVKN